VKLNYRFRIQPVLVGPTRHFQLRVGLEGDSDGECIPVHESAFATCVLLHTAHAAAFDAQLELTALLAWLDARHV
jgi:hypothetical protein